MKGSQTRLLSSSKRVARYKESLFTVIFSSRLLAESSRLKSRTGGKLLLVCGDCSKPCAEKQGRFHFDQTVVRPNPPRQRRRPFVKVQLNEWPFTLPQL